MLLTDNSLKQSHTLSISLSMVGVDAPTTASAKTLSPAPPMSDSESVPVPKQLSSASGRGLETQPTVSDNSVLTIVVANYWSLAHIFDHS